MRTTWREVETCADTFARLFYGRLFAIDPSIRRLFRDVDMAIHCSRFARALGYLAAGSEGIEALSRELEGLARGNVVFGTSTRHYETIGSALIWTLEQSLGDAWTPSAAGAWHAAYQALSRRLEASSLFCPTPRAA